MTTWSEDDLRRHQERTTRGGANQRHRARGVAKPCGMNNLEARYAEVLRLRELAGEVAWWKWDAINLRLGDNCHYRTDFLVMMADCTLELHETKGFMQDDALVKLKVVAAEFPFPVKLIKWVKGQWEVTDL